LVEPRIGIVELGTDLRGRDRRGVARGDAEELLQHDDERRVRHLLLQRRAAAFEEDDRLTGERLLELEDESRLAAAGVADHGHDLWRAAANPREAIGELQKILLAADERRQATRFGDAERCGDLAPTEDLVGADRLALATHLE